MLVSVACIAGQPTNHSIVPGWANTWEFVESWKGLSGQPEMVSYELRLISINGQAQAELDIDGHQMLCRVLASVKPSAGGLRFLFLRNREDHVLPKFEPGELMFELRKENGQAKTIWGALQPAFDEHQVPGIYLRPKK